jgi:hypothetical protein
MQVFLAYAPHDRELAGYLTTRLSEAGFEVWDPAIQVLPGDNPGRLLTKALENSEALVVLVSPESVELPSVRQVVSYALSRAQYKDRVISVLVRPTPTMPWMQLTQDAHVRVVKNWATVGNRLVELLERTAV